MLLIILLFILFAPLLYLLLKDVLSYQKVHYEVHKKFPRYKTYLLVGTMKDILFFDAEQAFTWIRKCALHFKATYSNWVSGMLVLNVIKGKDVELLLTSTKCTHKSIVYECLHPFMGTGLLTSNGKKWQQRRKILTPAFHFNILHQQFHKIFQDETLQFVKNIKEQENKIINLQSAISRYTLNSICETAMGVKINAMDEPDEYREKIYKIGEILLYRLIRPWLQSNFLCKITGYNTKLNKLLKPVHGFTENVIKERRKLFEDKKLLVDNQTDENVYETKKTRYAMLDTLLAAESRGEAIDKEGIREEVDTFMFEGHDTTACGLTFLLFSLAENQHIQTKLYEEIKNFKTAKDDFTMQELNQLCYLDRVIKEGLRLYPPVSFMSRLITDEIEWNNTLLPKDTITHIHIYDIHHDPHQYEDPETFNPDRFLPENITKRNTYSYIPFSAGPRNCIGQKFALLEMKTLLVKTILSFHLEPITHRKDLIFIADLVLRTKHPIYVKFNLREQ